MNYTKEIDSIIDWLTEEDGGHAVGEGNIKEAVNDLKALKQALNIDFVSNRIYTVKCTDGELHSLHYNNDNAEHEASEMTKKNCKFVGYYVDEMEIS